MSLTRHLKIVLIGGGSYTWGPKLISDIALQEDLEGSEIVLEDINEKPLNLVYNLGKKIIEKTGKNFSLEKTIHLKDSLEGADFVILAIAVGGLNMVRHDIEIPLKYGVYQSAEMAVGPAGFLRALRHIPVVLNIGRQMEKSCPNAWLINYTNPMSVLCRTLIKETKIKTIGLCDELIGVLATLKRIFKVEDSEICMQIAGINHLSWFTQLKIKGEDGFSLLRRYFKECNLKEEVQKLDWGKVTPSQDNLLLKSELLKIFGYFPCVADREIADFFPYFLTEETQAGRKYGVKITTIEHRLKWKQEAEKLIKDTLEEKIPLEIKPSGETAAQIISNLAGYGQGIYLMNLPNEGQIANLPKEVIVETLGAVDGNGPHPFSVGDLPLAITGILHKHIMNQELIVEAGLKGDKNLALQALVNDPLISDWEKANKLLEELLQSTADYLPQF